MKRIWIAAIVVIIGLVLLYLYLYKGHRDIGSEDATAILGSTEIVSQFSKDQEKATTDYLNKVVVVSGDVTDIDASGITLNDAVYAILLDTGLTNEISMNSNLKVKGRCIGYDELLEIVKLDQCILLK